MTALLKQVGVVDPSTLSPAQKKALALADMPGVKLYRRRGFWGFSPERVTLAIAASLCSLGLCRIARDGREPRLVATGAGQMTRAVMEQREARRAGA